MFHFRRICNFNLKKRNVNLFSLPKKSNSLRSFRGFHVEKNEELSFACLTPNSLAKSRTGGIIARLLVIPDIRLVGARMYKPSQAFINEMIHVTQSAAVEDGVFDAYEECLIKYIHTHFTKEGCAEIGITNRILVLFFAGTQTREKLEQAIGRHLPSPQEYGTTIRGAYGDYSVVGDKIITFEPAVLTALTCTSNRQWLYLLAKYAETDGGVVVGSHKSNQQTGLVMIKPDNLKYHSAKPGHIIDLFGTTGLQIVGARLVSMSPRQGKEFYGFLKDVFIKKLAGRVERILRKSLHSSFEFSISDTQFKEMTGILKEQNAIHEVNKIIHYMTGIHPDTLTSESAWDQPGDAKCFALLYKGVNAIEVLREKLGSTDPSQASEGSIRRDYGLDVMRNGAHASDSEESANRERKIVGLVGNEPSEEKILIEDWLKKTA